jgi:hypothetical protein
MSRGYIDLRITKSPKLKFESSMDPNVLRPFSYFELKVVPDSTFFGLYSLLSKLHVSTFLGL